MLPSWTNRGGVLRIRAGLLHQLGDPRFVAGAQALRFGCPGVLGPGVALAASQVVDADDDAGGYAEGDDPDDDSPQGRGAASRPRARGLRNRTGRRSASSAAAISPWAQRRRPSGAPSRKLTTSLWALSTSSSLASDVRPSLVRGSFRSWIELSALSSFERNPSSGTFRIEVNRRPLSPAWPRRYNGPISLGWSRTRGGSRDRARGGWHPRAVAYAGGRREISSRSDEIAMAPGGRLQATRGSIGGQLLFVAELAGAPVVDPQEATVAAADPHSRRGRRRRTSLSPMVAFEPCETWHWMQSGRRDLASYSSGVNSSVRWR